MGRREIPGKRPAVASISLLLHICNAFGISVMTAEELLLVTLSFIGILKSNSLSVFSGLPLHRHGVFFHHMEVWSPTGRWQRVYYQNRPRYPSVSAGCGSALRPGSRYRGHCARGWRKSSPEPASTPSAGQGSLWSVGATLAGRCFRLCSADFNLNETHSPSPGGHSRRRLLFPSLAEPEKLRAGFYSLQREFQFLPALTYHPWSHSPPSWVGWLGAAPCPGPWAHLCSESNPSMSPLQGWHIPSRWH